MLYRKFSLKDKIYIAIFAKAPSQNKKIYNAVQARVSRLSSTPASRAASRRVSAAPKV